MTHVRRKYLTREGIVERLRNTIKASKLNQTQWAIKMGISGAMVSAVLTKGVPPGPKIMKAIGVQPTPYFAVEYHSADTDNTEEEDTEPGEVLNYEPKSCVPEATQSAL
ncbi:MAG TPA: hypothetical protein V6C97_27325 [Oculatellaceae cyanobacterium]